MRPKITETVLPSAARRVTVPRWPNPDRSRPAPGRDRAGTTSTDRPDDHRMIDLDYLANVRPSHRQYAWQQLELYGFVHFGMNTMTGREWGTGEEDPGLFDPPDLDADEWAASLAAAGMRGLILTAKHHDGFCLWPSRY